MLTETLIREARDTDAEDIYRLIGELAEYERLSHIVETSPDSIRRDLIDGGTSARCLVLEEDDEIIGYAIYFPTYSTFLGKSGLWLEDLYVTPSKRGNGNGKALLRAVAAEAVKLSCGRLEWSVLDWNEPAIGFYRQMGASILDDWRVCRVTGDELEKLAGA